MNILLIGPEFHGYLDEMINTLKKEKHNVYFITNSFHLSFSMKIISKISKYFLQKKFSNYLENEIEKYSNLEMQRVVLIYGGDVFTKNNFSQLKKSFPNAEFIFYNWDSVCNNRQSLTYYKMFDKYFSFDLSDCKKYGYARLDNWYNVSSKINNNPKYDFGVLMTFSHKKIKHYVDILDALPKNLNGKQYLVLQDKLYYLRMKVVYHKQFKKIDNKNIYAKPLGLSEALDFYNDCKVIIDVPLNNQNGLTTRTFEVLKQEKKLITTNFAIKEYEFYTPNNIFIVDEYNKKIPDSFFKTPFDKNYSISDNYSLKSFVKKLFDL